MRLPLAALLLAAAPALAACTTGERGSRRPRGLDVPVAAAPAPRPPDPDRIEGTPSILVMWEPLAGEQEKFRNPRVLQGGRSPSTVGATGMPVVLVNASFRATKAQEGEVRALRARGAVGRVSDRDMLELLAAIQQTGFHRYAQPTSAVAAYFADDRARGRITIERDGESVTLVSRYGLGLAAATREIPGIYAAVKNTIFLLKNRTPSVGVSGVRDPVDPDRARRGGSPPAK